MDNRYCYDCIWYDPVSESDKLLTLVFYFEECGVELFDSTTGKLFLKKVIVPGLRVDDLAVGCKVCITKRQLEIVRYRNEATSRIYANTLRESTLGLIKPNAYHHIGDILEEAARSNFQISNLLMVKLTRDEARQFYAEHAKLSRNHAVRHWRDLIGLTNIQRAKKECPNSIRARFGQDNTRNAVHGSDSIESARKEINFFFGPSSVFLSRSTALLHFCTLFLIKPHCLREKTHGNVIQTVLNSKIEISAMRMVDMRLQTAKTFLAMYKGVDANWEENCVEVSSGPCIVMELRGDGVTKTVRELVGPSDPLFAKKLKSDSIRALYGTDAVSNAVHCSDLPENGVDECKFFFGQ